MKFESEMPSILHLVEWDFGTAHAFVGGDLAGEAIGIDAGLAHHIAQVAYALFQRALGFCHQKRFGAADAGNAVGLFGQRAQARMLGIGSSRVAQPDGW